MDVSIVERGCGTTGPRTAAQHVRARVIFKLSVAIRRKLRRHVLISGVSLENHSGYRHKRESQRRFEHRRMGGANTMDSHRLAGFVRMDEIEQRFHSAVDNLGLHTKIVLAFAHARTSAGNRANK